MHRFLRISPIVNSSTVNVVITPFHARDEFRAPLPDATATMYGFELEPSGTTFASPITVRIANTKSIPATFSIPTGFFDPTVGRWEHVAQATWTDRASRSRRRTSRPTTRTATSPRVLAAVTCRARPRPALHARAHAAIRVQDLGLALIRVAAPNPTVPILAATSAAAPE